MSFEFQSKTYPTAAAMHRAIAEIWLADGGLNDIFEQRSYLCSYSDEECADETIEQWLLDESEWATPRSFSRSALIKAYADLRREWISPLNDIFVHPVSTPAFAGPKPAHMTR